MFIYCAARMALGTLGSGGSQIMLGNVIGRRMAIGAADRRPGFSRHDHLLHSKVAAGVAGIACRSPACMLFDYAAVMALGAIRVHQRIDMVRLGIHHRMTDTAIPDNLRGKSSPRRIGQHLMAIHTLLAFQVDQLMMPSLVGYLSMADQTIAYNHRVEEAGCRRNHLVTIHTLFALCVYEGMVAGHNRTGRIIVAPPAICLDKRMSLKTG